jgi:hypothetical protein
MFLREIGLSAFGALLIFATPEQQAQAATMLTTKAHQIEQPPDQNEYGRNLRHRQQHWRNHHHDPTDFYNQHDQHHQQCCYDQYHQHEYLRHRRHGH